MSFLGSGRDRKNSLAAAKAEVTAPAPPSVPPSQELDNVPAKVTRSYFMRSFAAMATRRLDSVNSFTATAFPFCAMAMPFWSNENKWRNRGLTAVLLGLGYGQVQVQIALNHFTPRFIDALLQKTPSTSLLEEFALIAATSVVVNGAKSIAVKRLQMKFRTWLLREMLKKWTTQLAKQNQLEKKIDNIDGRLGDDTKTVAAGIELVASFLYCTSLATCFGYTLWNMSGRIQMHLGHLAVTVPGHLLILAGGYGIVYLPIAYFSGKSLTRATHQRQEKEGSLRYALGRVRENAAEIVSQGKTSVVLEDLLQLVEKTEGPWWKQSLNEAKIFVFNTFNGIVATPLPTVVTYATCYVTKRFTWGQMQQAAAAFGQVTSALSWPIDNQTQIAEWRASANRVLALWKELSHSQTERVLDTLKTYKPVYPLSEVSVKIAKRVL